MEPIMLRLRALSVSDVMNRHVVWLKDSQTIEQAAELFSHHGISSAPVVNETDRCVGILSVTDFLKARDASRAKAGCRVSECMTTGVQSVAPTVSLMRAAVIMSTEHIHHLPVIDAGERIVGVVSTMDVVSALINAVEEAEGPLLGSR